MAQVRPAPDSGRWIRTLIIVAATLYAAGAAHRHELALRELLVFVRVALSDHLLRQRGATKAEAREPAAEPTGATRTTGPASATATRH